MDNAIGKLTGTFLDEITYDIGSQNWTADDWKHDFEAMAFIGIDTVIIIRGGMRDQAVFPSEVVGNHGDPDLAQLFLDQAAKHGMRLFFGTYDSGDLFAGAGLRHDELSMNLRLVDEIMARYGGHPAFQGWYMTHEVCSNAEGIGSLYSELAGYLKRITPSFPILISPYFPSRLAGNMFQPPEQFGKTWRELLSGLTGLVDIIAFQDGTAPIADFPAYLAEAKSFTSELGIELWNNMEAFDRGLSYLYPARDIRVLRKRLQIAELYVTKHITFEFSHFISPNSCFPGAANLYRRYCETILGTKSPY